MNNTLALGVVVSGKAAYLVLGFAGIGVYATVKTGLGVYNQIQKRFKEEVLWQDDTA